MMTRQMMPATTVLPPKLREVMVAMVPLPGITPTIPAATLPRPRPKSSRFGLCWEPVKLSAISAHISV